MKTIGLIGGMSWESTANYYRDINEGVKRALGGLHSAKIVLVSVDFQPIETLQNEGNWQAAGEILAEAARCVAAGGADFFLICTNTMHKVAEQVENAVDIPLLHIADATGEVLAREGVKKVGLLGTAFTMEQAFYKGRLSEKFGIEVLVPAPADRERVHDIIYQELCLGRIESESRERFVRITRALAKQGAAGVILGCTEIGMLMGQHDTDVRLYDTTTIHTAQAVQRALSQR
jgi:aspartate racemase